MNPTNRLDMDDLIERALFSEPIRAVPPTLHLRIKEGVRAENALRVERHQQRFRWALLSTLGIAMLYTLFVGPYLTVSRGWVSLHMPGVIGYVRPIALFLLNHWTATMISLGLLAGAGLVAAIVAVIAVTVQEHGVRGIKST